MRKKIGMICLILILIVCAVILIAGCGAKDGINQGDNVQNVSDDDPQETSDNPNKGENNDTPDDEHDQPEVVVSGEKEDDPDAPSKGDDKSIWGIPDVIDTRTEDDGDILVLVNKYHVVSKDYRPINMVTIDDKYGTYSNMELKDVAYEAYKKMYNDAVNMGFDLKLCSTMRSYETQKTLYSNSLKNRGRQTTNIRSAYPGRSEHHTGFALDITSASMGWGLSQDFADYPDGKWINEHCHEYGFILRYPKGKTEITGYDYEPWHFRYVGVEVATYIMENDLTLEEYLTEV